MTYLLRLTILFSLFATLIGCSSSRIQNIVKLEKMRGYQNWIVEVKVKDIEYIDGNIRIVGTSNGNKLYVKPVANYMENPDSEKDIRIEKGKTYLMVLEPAFLQTLSGAGCVSSFPQKYQFTKVPYKALNLKGLYLTPMTEETFEYVGRRVIH